MKSIGCLLFSALVLASCATNAGVLEFDSAPLFGMIYDDDNQPCSGATLTLDGHAGPVSDIRGRFVLPDLSRGSHVLSVKKEGFETLEMTFDFLNRTDVLYLRVVSFTQLLSKAEQALRDRKWDQAEAYLGRAEKLDSKNSVYLYLRAIDMYKTAKFPQAIDALNAIVAKGDTDPYVYLFLADIYQKDLNDSAKAAESLQAYLSKRDDPDVEKRLQELKAASGAGQGGKSP